MVRLDKQSSGPRSENFTPLLDALALASVIFFESSAWHKHRYKFPASPPICLDKFRRPQVAPTGGS